MEKLPKTRPPTQYGFKRTPERMAALLEGLARGYAVGVAAEAAGISRASAFRWKLEDAEFAEAWADAVERGVDRLEDEAFRRAVEGIDRPLTYQGEIFSATKEYSDQLLLTLLKGKRRHIYGDRQVVEGPDNGPVKVEISARDALLEALADMAKRL